LVVHARARASATVPLSLAAPPCSVLRHAQARRPGEGASLARPRRRRNWPLTGRSTILGCRLAGTGHPPLCAVSYERRVETHVASVYFKCFKCFKGTLQVFHTDATKVYRDVAYVAMVVHVCCKLWFSMFHLFFRRMLQVCLTGCCICFHTYDANAFIWMLHMFTMVLSVLDTCFFCFQSMLKLLHLDVLKLD
jgi:hypothetical protein